MPCCACCHKVEESSDDDSDSEEEEEEAPPAKKAAPAAKAPAAKVWYFLYDHAQDNQCESAFDNYGRYSHATNALHFQSHFPL